MSTFSVFNQQKMPDVSSSHLALYGEDSIDVLMNHYGAEKPAHTVQGEEFMKPLLITSEVHTEWKTFRCFLSKKPEEDMKAQLRELARNDMLVTMFPNLSALSNVCLSIPVTTASVERSFSQMKLIKTRLRNRIGEKSLSYLMKIAIESPAKLTDEDLENIIDVWKRQPRRIIV